MNSIITSTVARSFLLPMLALGLVATASSVPVYASDCGTTTKVTGVADGATCAKSADQKTDLGVVIKTVTNVLLFVVGAVAVVMIVIGGFKYTVSNGDSTQVTSAKNTILYAVVGIVVALLAYAVVNFVTDSFIVPAVPTPPAA